VLGDGWTQDFLKVFRLNDLVRCGIPNHFPDHGAMYRPVANDSLPEQPLWNRELWPGLTSAWEAFGRNDPLAFYRSLARTPIKPDRKRGLWPFDTQSIAYELRCYLWHMFRYYHLAANAHLAERFQTRQPPIQWPWAMILRLLLAEFRLGVVSFNYDLFFELGLGIVVRQFGGQPFVLTVSAVMDSDYMAAPANSVLVRKIHGSIHHTLRTPLELLPHYQGPHPWKVPTRFENNVFGGVKTDTDNSGELKIFPFIPDIVPPGHPGDDICNPVSYALDRAKEQLRNSRLILFCGLSGNPPDTEEVQSLVRSIPSDSTVIHMGLEPDRTGCLAALLEEAGLRARHFVRAEDDLPTAIAEILKTAFPLRYSWAFAGQEGNQAGGG
jgi:hypothetical protein